MSGRYLIDTNTVIYFFRGIQSVVDYWGMRAPSEVKISSITYFELSVGATTSAKPTERLRQLSILQNYVEVIPFEKKEAESAAAIKSILKQTGLAIGPLDVLIAGVALANNLTLVTHNTSEFQRVPGLACIDWYLS